VQLTVKKKIGAELTMDRHLIMAGGLVVAVTAVIGGLAMTQDVDLNQNKGKAALVQLSGSITPESTGGLNPSGMTPSSVRSSNEKAMQKNPDAIIYEINSGGGAVVASKEIMREIESVDVPTVCRFRDVSASGGYLIALGCDRIVADSASLTGSIGVRSSYLEFSGLLEEYNVEYVNISSGKYKEVGSSYMNTSEEEKKILLNKTEKIHEEFVSTVREKRNITPVNVETVRTGEPFLGERAQSLGLVDEIGGRDTAIRTAENMTGKNLSTVKVQTAPEFNFLSLLTADINLEQILSKDSPIRAEY